MAETILLKICVLTISDRSARGEREDASGPAVCAALAAAFPAATIDARILPDEQAIISETLARLCDAEACSLILTTGGTGLAPRDVTPEATAAVIERGVPGIAEAIRAAGLHKTPHAMLSRALAGQRGQTLIVNLSGSPTAAMEQLAVLLPVLPHTLKLIGGGVTDCVRVIAERNAFREGTKNEPEDEKMPMKTIQIVGQKNHGKTTLVVDLVREFRQRGLRVGTIKHTTHSYDTDQPGSDSYQHRHAGAAPAAFVSGDQLAVFMPVAADGDYAAQLATLYADVDVLIIEGDRQMVRAAMKVEVWRGLHEQPPLAAQDDSICAIVTDDAPPGKTATLPRSDIAAVADFVLRD